MTNDEIVRALGRTGMHELTAEVRRKFFAMSYLRTEVWRLEARIKELEALLPDDVRERMAAEREAYAEQLRNGATGPRRAPADADG